MNKSLSVGAKNLNSLDLVFIAWGCITLPLWMLGFYQSFEDGAIDLQGIALSSMAIAITLCWIASPFFKRSAAIIAFVLGCGMTIVSFVNNSNNTFSSAWTVPTLILDIFLFVAPAVILLYLSNFRHDSQTPLPHCSNQPHTTT